MHTNKVRSDELGDRRPSEGGAVPLLVGATRRGDLIVDLARP